MSAGFKFNDWEMRGVPLRIEIGPRDVEQNAVVFARRDLPGKEGKTFGVPVAGLADAVRDMLIAIQANLLGRATAFREANTRTVASYAEFQEVLDAHGGFIRVHWAGTSEDEDAIKDETKATIRCFPFDKPEGEGVCFYTGKRTDQVAIFAGVLIPRAFFERATAVVARELLGQRLVRILDGQRLSGLICETEAYGGPDDQASHAYRLTPRSAIMYGPAGHAYVYFIYGMHFCLNAVTEGAGRPGAVLIRGLIPQEGLAVMRSRRPGAPDRLLASGPGRLCQALGVDGSLNGADLTAGETLFIEPGASVPDAEVEIGPRIGVRGDAETRGRPWRFVWR